MVESNTITANFENLDELYNRIHKMWKAEDKASDYISRSFFKERLHKYSEISVDWDKFTIPPKNPHYTRSYKANPENYGVIFFLIQKLKQIDVTILYTPKKDNPAHTGIKCDPTISVSLKNKIARQLQQTARWKIPFNEHVKDY